MYAVFKFSEFSKFLVSIFLHQIYLVLKLTIGWNLKHEKNVLRASERVSKILFCVMKIILPKELLFYISKIWDSCRFSVFRSEIHLLSKLKHLNASALSKFWKVHKFGIFELCKLLKLHKLTIWVLKRKQNSITWMRPKIQKHDVSPYKKYHYIIFVDLTKFIKLIYRKNRNSISF